MPAEWDREDDSGSPGSSARGDPDTVGGSDPFAEALNELQESGAVSVVVGNVPSDVHERICESMMGDHDRRRLYAVSGQGIGPVPHRLPAGTTRTEDHLQLVLNGMSARAVAADGRRSGSHPALGESSVPDPLVTNVADADLGRFGIEASNAIQRFADATSDPEPQEIRVCLDGVGAIFEEYGVQDATTFVHLLATKIRNVGGFGHLHLQEPASHEWVQTVVSLCDLVVDLRVEAGQAQQQWRIRDGPTSDWLPVE